MSALFLSAGRVNLGLLRDETRLDLVEYFSKLDGNKVIVWDPELIGPFNLIGGSAFLRDHNVMQMFQLQRGALQFNAVEHVIYVVRPKHCVIEMIFENVKREETIQGAKDVKKKFHLLFMPRGSLICEKKLADLGVFGSFSSITELPVLYPLDSDVVSLEMNSSFYECHVEHDYSSIYNVAAAVMKMQVLFGIIPNIYGIGKSAEHASDLILRMRSELPEKTSKVHRRFDSVFLFDRAVDMITPLATQKTYEGLIDELFGISHNSVKLPSEKLNTDVSPTNDAQPPPGELKSFPLSSAEELYAKLRDKNFRDVGPFMSQESKALSNVKSETNQAKSVQELKQIVEKLPRFQVAKKSLTDHLAIGEMIKHRIESDSFLERSDTEKDFLNIVDTEEPHPLIESMISKSEDLVSVLRLICLQSQTNSGLKKKVLEFYKREIIQTYGFKHVPTLQNLEKVGLLKTAAASSSLLLSSNLKAYNVLRKTLRLTINDATQNDFHHVYGGYAPLSIKLLQFLIHPGWRAITEIFKYLPEPVVDKVQSSQPEMVRRNSIHNDHSDNPKTVLVVFLGGCTFAEISALRALAAKKFLYFVVLTTKVINGHSFIKSLSEPLLAQSS